MPSILNFWFGMILFNSFSTRCTFMCTQPTTSVWRDENVRVWEPPSLYAEMRPWVHLLIGQFERKRFYYWLNCYNRWKALLLMNRLTSIVDIVCTSSFWDIWHIRHQFVYQVSEISDISDIMRYQLQCTAEFVSKAFKDLFFVLIVYTTAENVSGIHIKQQVLGVNENSACTFHIRWINE